MSFNTVQKNHPQAAKLFQVLSFLNPDGVLIGFLQSGIKGLPNDLQAMVASHIDLAKALLELERLSLPKWNRVTKTLVIHRLVESAIRDRMSEEEQITLSTIVINICHESFPKVLINDTHPVCRIYFGQGLTPLLNMKYGNAEAMKMHEDVLTKRRLIFGDDNPDTLKSMHRVGPYVAAPRT